MNVAHPHSHPAQIWKWQGVLRLCRVSWEAGQGGAERIHDQEGWRGGDHVLGEKDLWAEEVVSWVAVVRGVGGAGEKRS
jgi:hypothetical protein